MAERDATMGASREDALMPAIADVVREAGMPMREVRAIVCGSGPGSFTSLRIAAAIAKGLAESGARPLYAISSMMLAALELRAQPGVYVLHGDALRGERFVQRFEVTPSGTVAALGELARMPLAEVEQLATETRGALVAIGVKTVSESDVQTVTARARNVVELAKVWQTVTRVDIATWEPNYGRLAEAQVKWEETHQRALPLS